MASTMQINGGILPPVTDGPTVIVENLSIEYKLEGGWTNALNGINLAILPGEIHGLVGESGSGKSTLGLAIMRYMAANARVSAGSIFFEGEDITRATPADMRRYWGSKMALVPQDALAALNPSYPVGDQVAEIARQHRGVAPRAAWKEAVEMLRRVRIPDAEQVARRYPHQLSGGMQQRVTIAMALIARARLLVLDEPTTALDVTTQAVILDLVRDLVKETGAAALYVSHDLGVIAQLCDRVTVLYGGEIMASAPVYDVFKRPIHPYTISLLASLPRPTDGTETRLPTIEGVAPSLAERPPACVFAPRCPAAIAICHQEKPPLEQITVNEVTRLVKCHRWQEIANGTLVIDTAHTSENVSAPEGDRYILEAEHVVKTFKSRGLFARGEGVRAVDDVSIAIRERSTLGLVGESGSGKTTLARCIIGLEAADSGDMELLDIPLSPKLNQRPREALRAMQMVFQNPNDALNPYISVGEIISRTVTRLHGGMTRREINARVNELLSAVRLTPEYAARFPLELSGGEKQRVAIARAFASDPTLVLADEPTSSLDVSVQSAILNLLKDLRAEQGVSYLFISHDLRAVSYLADWIVVMYLGEIVETGTVDDVYNAPSHPYTEALISALPMPDPTAETKQIRLDGDPPSPSHLPTGCRFHTRCPRKIGTICEVEAPPVRDTGDGHLIRCHIPIEELTVLQQTPPPRHAVETEE